eukprot:2953217-Amphidinium_carterae.3
MARSKRRGSCEWTDASSRRCRSWEVEWLMLPHRCAPVADSEAIFAAAVEVAVPRNMMYTMKY